MVLAAFLPPLPTQLPAFCPPQPRPCHLSVTRPDSTVKEVQAGDGDSSSLSRADVGLGTGKGTPAGMRKAS